MNESTLDRRLARRANNVSSTGPQFKPFNHAARQPTNTGALGCHNGAIEVLPAHWATFSVFMTLIVNEAPDDDITTGSHQIYALTVFLQK